MTFQVKVMHFYVNFEAEVLKSSCEWEIMLQLEMQIEKKTNIFFIVLQNQLAPICKYSEYYMFIILLF